MSEEFSVSLSLPLDDDGFLRRECPSCIREFKWFAHEVGDPDAELVEQYFCPLCGVASGGDEWWTPAQAEYAQAIAAPDIEQFMNDTIRDAFRRSKYLRMAPGDGIDMDVETPEPMIEPNDMVIVESPCHPNEPIKVSDQAVAAPIHCLVCGVAFAV